MTATTAGTAIKSTPRTKRWKRWQRVGGAAVLVGTLGLGFAPAANAGLGYWISKLYWAVGGVVQAVHDLRDDVQGLAERVSQLELAPAVDADLQFAVTDNSAAIALLEQDLGALGDQVDALGSAAGGSGSSTGGSGVPTEVQFTELSITRLAPPGALRARRTVFGQSLPVNCAAAGVSAGDALPPQSVVTSTSYQCDTGGFVFELVVQLELASPGTVLATFFAPAGMPSGLVPELLELTGDYQAPLDGAAFAHIVKTLPAASAPGIQRQLELALRGEQTPFEVQVQEFPAGLGGSSQVLQVSAAR